MSKKMSWPSVGGGFEDDEGFMAVGGGSDDDDDDDDDTETKKKTTKGKKKKVASDDEESESETVASSDSENEDEDSDLDSTADPEEDDGDVAKTSATETGKKGESIMTKYMLDIAEDDDDEDENDDDNYLQKFDDDMKTNIIAESHPELEVHNNDEVDILSRVVRDENGVIIDPLHRTIPFLTKYERARILGERAKQINAGAKPFIEIESDIIDGYLIALKEFEQKKIPFIIKRPMPNGGAEYWKLRDLEVLQY